MKRTTFVAKMAIAAAAILAAGCTMHKQEAPALTGPSEYGTAIVVSVTPDTINQDGASQSVITVTARGPNGEPLKNVTVRSEIFVNGTVVSFGSLNARTQVTGTDGHATFVYTAPIAPPLAAGDTIVDIGITPIGTDFNNATMKTAAIRVVPTGPIVPPSGLTPNFAFTPSSPNDNQPVLFQACVDNPCATATNPIVSYSWEFGDGQTGTGKTVSHSYRTGGTYSVVLTVADAFGRTATAALSINVGTSAGPLADYVFSPTAPIVGQSVNFNGSASKPPATGSISSYQWDFGDGAFGGGITVSHTYSTPGQFAVTLIVTDNTGKTGTKSNTVTVSSDTPTANITLSPASPTASQDVFADGSTSTAVTGRTIASYAWTLDGAARGNTTTVNLGRFAGGTTHTVSLTVTDNAGKTATKTTTFTVTP